MRRRCTASCRMAVEQRPLPWALSCCTTALLAEWHASHQIVADTDKQGKVLMPGGCKRMLDAGPCAAGDADRAQTRTSSASAGCRVPSLIPRLTSTVLPVCIAGDADLVTETDKKCEALVLGRIRAAFPDHKFIGEEGSAAQVGCCLPAILAAAHSCDVILEDAHELHGRCCLGCKLGPQALHTLGWLLGWASCVGAAPLFSLPMLRRC